MFYFYVLENSQGELYYGSTSDLKRRLSEHKDKLVFSTKSGEWVLIYYEAYQSESDARRREQRVKDYGQAARQLRERIKESRKQKG